MRMIPSEVIEDILRRADIVQVISNYINVIKKGNSFVAICPFHDDKNPSMMISQTKQIYKCFACGAGGNVFTFVSNYEKIPFQDAVRKVAQIIHYESSLLEAEERKVDPRIRQSLKALSDAQNFYAYVLNTPAGQTGKKYFDDRGIDAEMIRYFGLGFSPENGEFSIRQLRAKDNAVETLEGCGILLHEGGGFTDRFHNRVTFPVYNEYSEVIGFSARRIDDTSDESKYVNSPSTSVFNKSSALYNYQNAKNEAKAANYCYIVEGFMDVFALYRCGVRSCVALMGTAFTKAHVRMLKRLNVELRLCLDGDDAGQHGMMAMCALLDEANISYRIVNYGEEKRDPDELYVQSGKEALTKLLNTLTTRTEFLMSYHARRSDLATAEGKKKFLTEMAPYYRAIRVEIDRELFVSQLASTVGTTESAVQRYLDQLAPEKEVITPETMDYNFALMPQTKAKMTAMRRIERNLIYYMIDSEAACDYIQSAPTVTFVENTYLLLANYVEELRHNGLPLTVKDLIAQIQSGNGDQRLIDELTAISTEKGIPCAKDWETCREYINECLKRMQKILTDKNFYDRFYSETFEMDEIMRAELLDKRRKGAN